MTYQVTIKGPFIQAVSAVAARVQTIHMGYYRPDLGCTRLVVDLPVEAMEAWASEDLADGLSVDGSLLMWRESTKPEPKER